MWTDCLNIPDPSITKLTMSNTRKVVVRRKYIPMFLSVTVALDLASRRMDAPALRKYAAAKTLAIARGP